MARLTLRDVPELQRVAVRDGVVLRPLQKEDAAALLAILDEDVTIREHVTVAARFQSVDDIEAEVVDLDGDSRLIRYVVLENSTVVGMVNFWQAGEFFGDKANPDDYGFGYFLALSARGRGLVTDSLRMLMDIASKELGATSFIAFCETDNTASDAVLKKVGLEPTGETWIESENGWAERKYQRKVHNSVQ